VRCQCIFTVTFHANSKIEARSIAASHYQQIRDDLRIGGADHPSECTLDHLYADDRDILEQRPATLRAAFSSKTLLLRAASELSPHRSLGTNRCHIVGDHPHLFESNKSMLLGFGKELNQVCHI